MFRRDVEFYLWKCIMAPAKVLIQDTCPWGLLEVLTGAHMRLQVVVDATPRRSLTQSPKVLGAFLFRYVGQLVRGAKVAWTSKNMHLRLGFALKVLGHEPWCLFRGSCRAIYTSI